MKVSWFSLDSADFERLKMISVTGNAHRKSGIRRAGAAVATGGANLALTSNMRGRVTLNIKTEFSDYSMSAKASDPIVQKAERIAAAGSGVLSKLGKPNQRGS